MPEAKSFEIPGRRPKKISTMTKSDAERHSSLAAEKHREARRSVSLPKIKEDNELGEAHWNPVTKKVQDEPASKEEIESLAAKARTKKKVRLPQGSVRKTSKTFKPSSREDAKANIKSWNDYWSPSSKEQKEEYMSERTMTSSETKKEESLKKKYDDSGMKASMIDQYGQEKGRQVYFAYIRKTAMGEGFIDPEDEIPTSSGRPGRKPIENVASHPNPRVRKKAVAGMRKQMEKEYGGKWKTRGNDPSVDESLDYNEIYNLIIKNLTENHYAKSYAAAEVMLEHFSDEFISSLVGKYIEEKARGTRAKSTVHAYDVDETLFSHGKGGRPNVKVHVNDASGKRVHSLTNQEFNTHKLEKGHSYDFSEFRSAKKFAETGKPNKKVIKDLKRRQARGQNVHLITARDKFDDPKAFHSHLQKHGIDVHPHNIHYTGGMKKGANKERDIGDKKVAVANAIAKQHKATHIHMHDDAPKVLNAFEKQKKADSGKKIKTHLIKPNKTGEPTSRSFQATKEEMTTYEYWKQFIDE